MFKMIDVLEQNFAQTFPHALNQDADRISEQLQMSILNASEIDLKNAINHFLDTQDASETALALDISTERLNELKSGIALKDASKISDTLKVVALCLALESDSLDLLEVSDISTEYFV